MTEGNGCKAENEMYAVITKEYVY